MPFLARLAFLRLPCSSFADRPAVLPAVLPACLPCLAFYILTKLSRCRLARSCRLRLRRSFRSPEDVDCGSLANQPASKRATDTKMKQKRDLPYLTAGCRKLRDGFPRLWGHSQPFIFGTKRQPLGAEAYLALVSAQIVAKILRSF